MLSGYGDLLSVENKSVNNIKISFPPHMAGDIFVYHYERKNVDEFSDCKRKEGLHGLRGAIR